MKIIAFYLPQFHETKENNRWWGRGFTEWTSLKNASSLFEGHNQPRIPLHNNYYNLLDDNVKMWQVNLAHKYGIYGFCIYHYWFNGHMLLEKPLEQFKSNTKLKIHYCISWANESWTNAWVSDNAETLIEQTYGNQDEWTAHFQYLLPYFLDDRYIKIDGKPLFIIYRPELIDDIAPMLSLWNILAKENGIPGIAFASQQMHFDINSPVGKKYFSYQIEYQPDWAKIKLNSPRTIKNGKKNLLKRNYDEAWKKIINSPPISEKSIPGAFVDWDNTPRRHNSGSLFLGVTPEKFQKYFTLQIKHAKEDYKKDFLFLFAWNEWAEGGYLEPDEKWQYQYLESIRNALLDCGEYPEEDYQYE